MTPPSHDEGSPVRETDDATEGATTSCTGGFVAPDAPTPGAEDGLTAVTDHLAMAAPEEPPKARRPEPPERPERAERADGAEVIDLVHLPRGTRPTPIAYLEYDEVGQCRSMDCDFYAQCLAFAARVRWKSFHCRQCPQHPERAAKAVGLGAAVVEQAHGAAVIKLR